MKIVFRGKDILDGPDWTKKQYDEWIKNPITTSLLHEIEVYNKFCEINKIENKIFAGFLPPGESWDGTGKIINVPTVYFAAYGPDNIETVEYMPY